MIVFFGVGVHCDEVLNKTKYRGSGHLFAITTWGFGITIVLLVFGGVCINPAMAFTQAILGMIPWNCFIPYCCGRISWGGLCGACIVYVMYADRFKASEDVVDLVAIRNIFSTNQISEIFREISLLRWHPIHLSFVISSWYCRIF